MPYSPFLAPKSLISLKNMSSKRKYLKLLLIAPLAALFGALTIFAGTYIYLSPKLPAVEALRDVQLQSPLRVYSQDGKLIGEFGEKRRIPIAITNTPQNFIHALLAAEDDGFYSHHGVDIKGLTRAALELAISGQIQTGGSTITMQVAKNYFLSSARTFTRKFNEILLALQIERELSKNEILELYLNKIYLGNRAYGIQAAAQVYYGKDISELSVAQLAMIAGLPKAPSRFNPIINPERALIRRNWILRRMHELNYIKAEHLHTALAEPITAELHATQFDFHAPYVAEAARLDIVKLYGEHAYTDGFSAITTIDSRLQQAAQKAVIAGIDAYEMRHGYRGPERKLPLPLDDDPTPWLEALNKTPTVNELEPAIVSVISDAQIELLTRNNQTLIIDWETIRKDLRPFINESRRGKTPETPSDTFEAGDLIRIKQQNNQITIGQLPNVQAALIALNPINGSIRSLVGGYNFSQSHYNRATQAQRQPGSNFKPFIYTVALEKGFTPASIINDAPVVFSDTQLESTWRPENSSGKFFGPTPLRKALYKSRNLVSIRLLRSIGVGNVVDEMHRFGFEPSKLPRDLSLALGSHAVTPSEIATGYATFANGGYKISPHLIDRILDRDSNQIYRALPETVCKNCNATNSNIDNNPEETPEEKLAIFENIQQVALAETNTAKPTQAIKASQDPQQEEADTNTTADEFLPPVAEQVVEGRIIYIMNSILRDVIKKGTAKRAKSLKRSDLAGKTGTTNGPKDAWFSGYNEKIVATAWLGFDNNSNLGRGEYGGSAALPIWINFMKEALKDVAEDSPQQPDGLVMVRIDPETGLRASPQQSNAYFEIFREELQPQKTAPKSSTATTEEVEPEELF